MSAGRPIDSCRCILDGSSRESPGNQVRPAAREAKQPTTRSFRCSGATVLSPSSQTTASSRHLAPSPESSVGCSSCQSDGSRLSKTTVLTLTTYNGSPVHQECYKVSSQHRSGNGRWQARIMSPPAAPRRGAKRSYLGLRWLTRGHSACISLLFCRPFCLRARRPGFLGRRLTLPKRGFE